MHAHHPSHQTIARAVLYAIRASGTRPIVPVTLDLFICHESATPPLAVGNAPKIVPPAAATRARKPSNESWLFVAGGERFRRGESGQTQFAWLPRPPRPARITMFYFAIAWVTRAREDISWRSPATIEHIGLPVRKPRTGSLNHLNSFEA